LPTRSREIPKKFLTVHLFLGERNRGHHRFRRGYVGQWAVGCFSFHCFQAFFGVFCASSRANSCAFACDSCAFSCAMGCAEVALAWAVPRKESAKPRRMNGI